LNIWEIFNTLKAAEMFIAIHKPTPYSDGCECGACRVTRTLKNVREVMRQNAKSITAAVDFIRKSSQFHANWSMEFRSEPNAALCQPAERDVERKTNTKL
jgi:3-hydroxy-3-methylglutaryl CoA synthase